MAGLVLLALIGAACSSSAHNVGTSASPTSSTATSTTPTTARGFRVGDVVSDGGWDISVVAVHNPFAPSSDVFHAAQGRHYVGLDLTLKNTTDTPQTLVVFTLSIEDAEGHSYEVFPMPGATTFSADNVGPGSTRRGVLPFEVDDTATPPLTFVFWPNPTASKTRIVLT